MRNTPYWKAMCSPFKRLTLKWYIGKTQVGVPYFLPRKLVSLSDREVYEWADEEANRLVAAGERYDYASLCFQARRKQKFVPRIFGFDSTGLGFKTKWSDTDYRYEWSPVFSFVCFGYQIAAAVVPKLPKDNSISYYWEAWLYYNYNTDATKTPKERIAEAREARPLKSTIYRKGEDPVTVDWWDLILRKKYLK